MRFTQRRWQRMSLVTMRRLLLMFPCIPSITTSIRFILLALVMFVLPLPIVAQGDQAAQKPKAEDAVKQQPSPEPAKPDAARRAEQQTGTEEENQNRPRDPMSTATFNGLRIRSIGAAVTSGR